MWEWLDPGLSVGGLLAGVMVGLTGMGGAALVTPMLVLFFNVPAAAAVSSDVVASAVMKPVGAFVHIRHSTVHWGIVGWLSAGSIPGVLIGTLIFAIVSDTEGVEDTIRVWIGLVLILALVAMVGRAFVPARATRLRGPAPMEGTNAAVRIAPTIILGFLVGLLVGTTSVGSGSLIVITMLLLYPLLRPSVLVGTDLTQAVPMLVVGAIAHAGIGGVDWAVTASLLVGQIPGVWLGARMSSRYDGLALRWLLMVILAAIAVRLLGAPAELAGGIAIGGSAVVLVYVVRQRLARQQIQE